MGLGHSRSGRLGRWPLALIVAGMLLSQAINTMVGVAVPTMISEFQVGIERAGWIISAYLLPVAVLMPSWGAAGDLFGRRRAFRLGLLIFAVGAGISALARSFEILLVGQFVQACGASALQPNGTAIVTATSSDRGRGRVLGRLRMLLSFAGIAGGPLGGWLTQVIGWPAIFIAAPVGAIALAGLLGRVAPDPPIPGERRRFDVPGAVVLSLTLLAFLLALSLGQTMGWTSPVVLALGVSALLGGVVFLPIESRQPQPLMPPALFRQRDYRMVIITGFFQAFACFGTALLGPLLLQSAFHLTPAYSGWLLAAFPCGMALSGIPGGILTDRFGGRLMTLVSLVGTALSLVLLAVTAWVAQPLLFVPGALLGGFAAGCGLVAMSAFVLQVSGERWRGVAMGVFTMISIMGDIVGVALLPMLLSERTGQALQVGFGQVYLIAAGVALVALLPALAMRSRPTASDAGEASLITPTSGTA